MRIRIHKHTCTHTHAHTHASETHPHTSRTQSWPHSPKQTVWPTHVPSHIHAHTMSGGTGVCVWPAGITQPYRHILRACEACYISQCAIMNGSVVYIFTTPAFPPQTGKPSAALMSKHRRTASWIHYWSLVNTLLRPCDYIAASSRPFSRFALSKGSAEKKSMCMCVCVCSSLVFFVPIHKNDSTVTIIY